MVEDALAVRFGVWDAASFDPDFDSLPLDVFVPLLENVFGESTSAVLGLLTELEAVRDTSHPDKERVSGLEHCLQMATRARRSNAGEEIVVAALVHDIGRTLNDAHHGEVAAALVQGRLPEPISQLLINHSHFQHLAWEESKTQALGHSCEVGVFRTITEDVPVDGYSHLRNQL